MYCLEKDLEAVLKFYEFPQTHRVSIKTTNIREMFQGIQEKDKANGFIS